jgi:hypothetical protein
MHYTLCVGIDNGGSPRGARAVHRDPGPAQTSSPSGVGGGTTGCSAAAGSAAKSPRRSAASSRKSQNAHYDKAGRERYPLAPGLCRRTHQRHKPASAELGIPVRTSRLLIVPDELTPSSLPTRARARWVFGRLGRLLRERAHVTLGFGVGVMPPVSSRGSAAPAARRPTRRQPSPARSCWSGGP